MSLFTAIVLALCCQSCLSLEPPVQLVASNRPIERITFSGEVRVGLSQTNEIAVTRVVSAWGFDEDLCAARCFVMASKKDLVLDERTGGARHEVLFKNDHVVKIKKTLLLDTINTCVRRVPDSYELDQPYFPMRFTVSYRGKDGDFQNDNCTVRTSIPFEEIWARIVMHSQ